MLGPNTSFAVLEGDSLDLSVHAKYERKTKRARASSLLPSGSGLPIPSDYGSMSLTGGLNPLLLYKLAEILASDLKSEPEPEAYMGYALYDADSNLYEKGKILLSSLAENRHEQLTHGIKVEKGGYIETFLVNETAEDVFFDNFRIQSQPSITVQVMHYYPFGMEMPALAYNNPAMVKNRYLYNGKEKIDEVGLLDYGFRYYDPAIGRFTGVDPIASDFPHVTPYNYAENYPTGAIDLWGLQKLVTTVYEVQRTLQDKKLDFKVNQLGPTSVSEPTGAEWSGYKQNNVFFFEGQQVNSLSNIEGYTEWSDNKSAESARSFGEALELTGDIVKYLGIGVTPFAPEIGLPMIKAGSVASTTGLGIQVAADLTQEKYQEAVTKIGIEALTGGGSKLVQKAVNKLNLEEVATQVLNTQVEAATEVAKITINKKVDNINKEKQ